MRKVEGLPGADVNECRTLPVLSNHVDRRGGGNAGHLRPGLTAIAREQNTRGCSADPNCVWILRAGRDAGSAIVEIRPVKKPVPALLRIKSVIKTGVGCRQNS